METDELNARFEIEGSLEFVNGPGGSPLVEISTSHGSASVALHGGHVLHYTPYNQKPVLWMSEKAVFSPGKAIRGGIPVCWPWFGPHPSNPELPAHGLARVSNWVVTSTDQNDDSVSIEMELQSDESSLALWPHLFVLTIRITLGKSLNVALTAHNNGGEAMICSAALHSYFAISDISQIQITGLEGTRFRDQLDNDQIKVDHSAITIDQEVDRVYHDTDSTCKIIDSNWKRRITVAKSGSNSTVVWNPWITKSARMADFGDDEYLTMVCVETTNADADTITIRPGEKHTLVAELSAANID